MEDRVSIHFSVEDGIIEVEQKKGPLISRKEISRDQLLNCFRKSVYIREDAPPVLSSGFLPLNTLAVRQTKESVSVVVWYPRLRADLSLYKTPYPDFPNPPPCLRFFSRGRRRRCERMPDRSDRG